MFNGNRKMVIKNLRRRRPFNTLLFNTICIFETELIQNYQM